MEKKNNDDKILSVSFSSKQENQEIEFNLKTSVKDEENAPKISSTDLDGKFTPYLVICIFVAACASVFQQGYQIGMYNTPEKVVKDFIKSVYFERNNVTMSENSLVVNWTLINCLYPFGGIFGAIISGSIADKFGRKRGLMLTNILVIIVGVLNIISKFISTYEMLIVARFIAGLFCGLFTGILPIFLNEISPPNLRGLAGTVNQFTVVIGILVANVFGLEELLGTDELWPVITGFIFIPAVFNFCLVFITESPKYLFITNNKVQAKSALVKLRKKNKVLIESELQSYENEQQELKGQEDFKWSDFINISYLRRPLIVTIILQMSQQFSGINAVMIFSTEIFTSAGIDGKTAVLCTILLNIVNLIMTFVCLVVIDRAGRRILLLIGMVGMCFSSITLALFMTLTKEFPDNTAFSVLTIVFAVFYIIFFAIGPGAIPWIITSELFDSGARAKSNSIACFTNWFCNFLVTLFFPLLIQPNIGSYSFFIFGVILVFFSLFVLFFVPETKNKSIDELKDLFSKRYIFFDKKYF